MRKLFVLGFIAVIAAGLIIAGCAKKKDIPLEPGVIEDATNTPAGTMTFTLTETPEMSPTNSPVLSPTCTSTNTPEYSPTNTQVVSPTFTATTTPDTLSPLLDDCDDGDNANNWGGYWYTFDDLLSSSDNNADGASGCTPATEAGISYVFPHSDEWAAANADAEPVEFFMSNVTTDGWESAAGPGYGDTGHAARITGYAVGTDYGQCLCGAPDDAYGFRYGFVGVGTNLSDPKGEVDISEFTGIRFYHKGDGKSYRFKLGTTNTTVFPLGENDDMYGLAFTTSGSWQLFEHDFTELTQEGWGNTPPGGIDDVLQVTESFQWQTTSRACLPPDSASLYEIDLYVDELEFY